MACLSACRTRFTATPRWLPGIPPACTVAHIRIVTCARAHSHTAACRWLDRSLQFAERGGTMGIAAVAIKPRQ